MERRQVDLTGLAPEELRALIADLNERADEVGCLVLHDGRPCDRVAVIFAGNQERFHMLSVAAKLRFRVIYVQDLESGWYQGSGTLPDLAAFCEGFLAAEVGPAHSLVFGQSSGAYAALVASTYLERSTVVACAPQTFSDAQVKSRLQFVGIRALSTPEDLIDVRTLLGAKPDPGGLRAVVIAAGELDNPATAHYWMDYLHCLRIADAPGVSTYIVNANTHVIVHGRVTQFATLLDRLAENLSGTIEQRRSIVATFLAETFGGGTTEI